MSHRIYEHKGISITSYSRGMMFSEENGARIAYQVTWKSPVIGRDFDYVCFESKETALELAKLLEERIYQ